MKIVVGLGNPGDKYKHTRHNAGFLALDFYLHDKEVIRCESKFSGQICEMHFSHHKTFFVKPHTYMNKSGNVVKALCDFYKIDLRQNLLIIHDDKDLPLGTIRVTNNASAAGHRGVQNIIDMLGTKEFRRIRIGVETRTHGTKVSTEAFVLQNFHIDELKTMHTTILPQVTQEIERFIHEQ